MSPIRTASALTLLSVAAILHAQTLPNSPTPQAVDAARITGTLADVTGAAIPNASLTLTRIGPATTPQTIKSAHDGTFAFPHLSPGDYRLTVHAPGFNTLLKDFTLTGSDLDLSTLALTLTVGVDMQVDVSGLTQVEIANEQIAIEEHQRLFGLLPNFYVSYNQQTAPLTAKQKFRLAGRTVIDPAIFVTTGINAGIEQATGELSGYGYGWAGYGTRYAASYGDALVGITVSAAIVPSILHQDPRYFFKGTGSIKSRIGYALATPFRIKGDNGKWQPNYSDFSGTVASLFISNTYAPAENRNNAATLVTSAAIGTAGEAVGALLQEFLFNHLTTRVKVKPTSTTPGTPAKPTP